MSKLKLAAQSFFCAAVMFMAINSIGTMCVGRYYQPTEPKEMSKFKNK